MNVKEELEMDKEMFEIVLDMYKNYKDSLLTTMNWNDKITDFTNQYKNIFTNEQLDKLCDLEQEVISLLDEWD